MNSRRLSMDGLGVVRPSGFARADPEPGKRMVLLVHGYNNNPAEAAKSYFALRRNLDNVLRNCGTGEAMRKQFQQDIWEFYWPGFEALSHVSDAGAARGWPEAIASAPGYPLEVKKARAWVPSGLAAYLKSASPSEIFLIGHSLGCRVVLETVVRLVAPVQRIAITGFLLMAGAVPVDLLLENTAFFLRTRGAGKRYCLFSFVDMVLGLTFPPGQILAGEIPRYGAPEATGLTGAPAGFYTMQGQTWLSHGGYWQQGLLKGRSPHAELLSEVLGAVPERELVEKELRSLERAFRSRAVPSNIISLRALMGDDWLADWYQDG